MPKVKSKKAKEPEGFDVVKVTLEEFEEKLTEVQNADSAGKRKDEIQWPIFRLHHERSRYIYDMYYLQKKIKKEVYDYCVKQGYADALLIAKWKKQGYEKLCCMRCINTRETNYGTTCVCRVPRRNLEEGKIFECKLCGCKGCSSDK